MSITIVVPCFNEAARWKPDYWQEMLALPGIRWFFVDDGSTDETGAILDATSSQGPCRVLHLPANAGKAEAVRKGMLAVLAEQGQADAVGYMDADGAFDADDVQTITSVFQQRGGSAGDCSAVWSSRVALAGRNIRRSTSRHYIGRVVATIVSVGQQEIPYDTQSGLKLFQPSEELAQCLETPFKTRWLFELELLSRWHAITGNEMRIWEEPLDYWHDVPGSKIKGRELARVVRELVVVKVEQRRARAT